MKIKVFAPAAFRLGRSHQQSSAVVNTRSRLRLGRGGGGDTLATSHSS